MTLIEQIRQLQALVARMTDGPWEAGSPSWKRGSGPYKTPITAPSGTVANALTFELGRTVGSISSADLRWVPPAPCASAIGIVALRNEFPAIAEQALAQAELVAALLVERESWARHRCNPHPHDFSPGGDPWAATLKAATDATARVERLLRGEA